MTVLVIGAGPVGLTMAAELTRYGVKVRLVDKAPGRSDASKALVVWSRTLELLEAAGCAPAFVAAGLQVTVAAFRAGKRRLGQIRLDELDTPYPYALMLPQSETELLLEQHLNGLGVQVERAVALAEFGAGADGVHATLRHADGRAEDVQADWLIGCDGAHSTVRHGLGMGFDGDTLASQWILADVHLDGLDGGAAPLEIFLHGDGVLALFPIGRGRFRVIGDVGPTAGRADPSPPSLAEVQALLDRRGPGGIRASDPIWLSGFRINERKVRDYRAGRVFLTGDAAHVHSPAGGQGMNTGMQDAINLAWKLALVCRGEAPDTLLDSYSAERSAVGRQVLANAGRLTRIGVTKNPVLQALRNAVAPMVLGLPPVRRAMARMLSELAICYTDSPLNGGGRGAGTRAVIRPGAPVGSGNAPRFALFAPEGDAAAGLIARYPGLLEPRPRAPLDRHRLALVRPDGYVAITTGAEGWAEIGRHLDRISSRTRPCA